MGTAERVAVLDEVVGEDATEMVHFFLIFKMYFYREKKEGREREGEKHQCDREASIGCLSYPPAGGPSLQPRHVP